MRPQSWWQSVAQERKESAVPVSVRFVSFACRSWHFFLQLALYASTLMYVVPSLSSLLSSIQAPHHHRGPADLPKLLKLQCSFVFDKMLPFLVDMYAKLAERRHQHNANEVLLSFSVMYVSLSLLYLF